ncbi:unnamed protein product [Candidula unifasciata]|uniref:Aminotransferase class V domain-containing protein n=1 Tax=Candidula unifasciata TaxID=100452 RepID=A0A8S3ZU37_9EUPU|nr:unnamed protein product [Candidula unifasciata]
MFGNPGCKPKKYELDIHGLSSVNYGKEIKEKEFFLNPDIVFFNHGSYGTVPRRVHDLQMKYMQEREEHPDLWFRITAKHYMDRARQEVADFVGADVESLLLVSNATTAINIIVKSFPFKSGDAILDTSLTYGAVKNLCADFTSRLRPDVNRIILELDFPIESADDIILKYEEILEQNPEIRMVILDHITSPTSIVMPVERLVDICHKHGAVVVIDGAHAIGQIPLNMQTIGADVYISNLHKWCFAPRGVAFMSFDNKHAGWIHPSNTSWQLGLSLDKQFFDQGTRDHTPYICARHALQFYMAIGGMDKIVDYTRQLADTTLEIFSSELGLEAIQIPELLQAPNMRLVKLPSFPKFPCAEENTWSLQQAMFGGTKVFGLLVFISGAFYFRFSVQIYNDLEEIRTVVKVVQDFIAKNV